MVQTLSYCKALADETRLRLVHILYRHELNVNELVTIMDMGQSRISRHLKILSAAGLLTWRRDGLWVFYSVPTEGQARSFIEALMPFLLAEPVLQADMDMAVSMIEERASKTQQFFNTIAEDWDKLSRDVLGVFDLPKAILDRMPACASAADLGCGTGDVLKTMLEKAQFVIGVDGSARMLELARRRFVADAERISLRIGDLAHLPLKNEEVEFVSLNMVLHHLPKPIDALREIWRVLRPQGTLVLTDFASHTDERMRFEYNDRWLGFDSEVLHVYLQRAGFSVASTETIPVERALALHCIVAKRSA